MTGAGMMAASRARPSQPVRISATPARRRVRKRSCWRSEGGRWEKTPEVEVTAAWMAAVDPAAPLAMPGQPPRMEVRRVWTKQAYMPMMGRTLAVMEKAMASTTRRQERERPRRSSRRREEGRR